MLAVRVPGAATEAEGHACTWVLYALRKSDRMHPHTHGASKSARTQKGKTEVRTGQMRVQSPASTARGGFEHTASSPSTGQHRAQRHTHSTEPLAQRPTAERQGNKAGGSVRVFTGLNKSVPHIVV